jgi:hypothetical protein
MARERWTRLVTDMPASIGEKLMHFEPIGLVCELSFDLADKVSNLSLNGNVSN